MTLKSYNLVFHNKLNLRIIITSTRDSSFVSKVIVSYAKGLSTHWSQIFVYLVPTHM